MDASSSGSNSFFAWPAGILTSLNIKRNDIGVTGKMKLSIGKTERFVYLPLRIRKQGESKKNR
jgi:hypothetical protein